MPGSVKTKKDLYLAESMAKLNALAEIPAKMTSSSARILVKTADKMLKEAESSDNLGDEERAYVLYMKYFNVVTYIKKTQDYKKDKEYYNKLLGQKNLLTVIEKAETLSSNLKERYDFVEAKHVAEKLASLNKEEQEMKTKLKEEEKKEKEKVKKSNEEVKVKPVLPVIQPTDLYHILSGADGKCLIIDVRSADDFKESHINHKCCINIPSEIIPPGTTVTYINKSLPPQSQALWSQRSSMEKIILLDWDSTLDTASIGTPIRTLKDAIFKYDSTVILQHEPLILEGGYDQWLLYYPTMTTNSKVSRPTITNILSPVPSLDFDYPDFDSAFIMTPSPSAGSEKLTAPVAGNGPSQPSLKSVNGDSSSLVLENIPRIDRSTKPKPVSAIINDSGATFSETVVMSKVPKMEPSKSRTMDANISTISSDQNILENSSSTSLSKYSKEIESELAELEKIKKQKEDELLKFSKEKEVLALEHKARLEKLKMEENKISELEKMKQQQQKDVSDLMRMKKKLQDDIRIENEEVQETEKEEIARKEELEHMQKQEDEKRRRQAEVEKLRLERKRKEDLRIKQEQEEKERKEKEAAEKAVLEASERARREEESRQIEIRLAEERAEKLRQEQEMTRLEKEKLEKEEQLKKAEEIRQAEEAKRKLEEQQKQAKEQLESEKLAKEKIEKEKAKQAQKIAEEKMKIISEEQSRTKVIPSPGLPVGWERRLDANTRRYFYINHLQSTTQWEPPVTPVKGTPPSHPGTYTAKLQDEPAKSTRGLKRSNSSPNIAQMMEDEQNARKQLNAMPQIDRTKKPASERAVVTPSRATPQKVILMRDLQAVYGNVGRALTGLRNLGNTCYMNSTIQCLNNTSPLVTYFLQGNYMFDINRESVLGCHGEVADDFAVIVKALWSGQYRCITPRDFKSVVGKHQPMFAGFDQQDSQEFLTFLLDGLHEGLNRIKHRPQVPEQDNENVPDTVGADIAWKHHLLLNESIIVELFQGQFRSTLQCLTCRKTSVTFQVFMYLSLPIVSSSRCTLQDCLNQFLREEKMTGSSRWKCPRCKVERDSVKKIDIWKLPRILLIGLNRFFHDGPWRQKISSYVDFPVKGLDLSSFVQSPKHRDHPYHLYGISNHYGTMEGGHYTAYCRNPCTQKWYKFDDHEVFEMSVSEVKTSAAFVLYYTSIELMPPDFRQQFS